MAKQDKDIQLHSEQLIVEVIELMLYHEQYTLPMYQGRKCIMISFKDLIAFLVEKMHGYDMLFHKFNFTLESVVITTFLPHGLHNNTIAQEIIQVPVGRL